MRIRRCIVDATQRARTMAARSTLAVDFIDFIRTAHTSNRIIGCVSVRMDPQHWWLHSNVDRWYPLLSLSIISYRITVRFSAACVSAGSEKAFWPDSIRAHFCHYADQWRRSRTSCTKSLVITGGSHISSWYATTFEINAPLILPASVRRRVVRDIDNSMATERQVTASHRTRSVFLVLWNTKIHQNITEKPK